MNWDEFEEEARSLGEWLELMLRMYGDPESVRDALERLRELLWALSERGAKHENLRWEALAERGDQLSSWYVEGREFRGVVHFRIPGVRDVARQAQFAGLTCPDVVVETKRVN